MSDSNRSYILAAIHRVFPIGEESEKIATQLIAEGVLHPGSLTDDDAREIVRAVVRVEDGSRNPDGFMPDIVVCPTALKAAVRWSASSN